MRMLLLLPLLLIVGFEATLFSNFPFPWRISFGCFGLLACYPIPLVTYNWFNFELDLLFYTLLQYWLTIIVTGVHRRKLSSALSLGRPLLGKLLADPFKLALMGGALMLFMPLFAFPTGMYSGQACLVSSPCQSQLDNNLHGWSLATTLWGISGVITMFAAPLGVVDEKWHRLLGSSFVGLSGVHLSGLEVFFASGAYALFNISQVLLPALATVFGPLMVLSGAYVTLRNSRRHSKADG